MPRINRSGKPENSFLQGADLDLNPTEELNVRNFIKGLDEAGTDTENPGDAFRLLLKEQLDFVFKPHGKTPNA
jgi:hypothetical protein